MAAVLVYRTLTYLVPIAFGIVTYLFWKRNTSWLNSAPPLDPALASAPADRRLAPCPSPPSSLPPGTRVRPAPPSSTRRRRRPSGEPPPLPYELGRSGRRWAWLGGAGLAFWVSVMFGFGSTVDRIDTAVLRWIASLRTDSRHGDRPPAREARLPDPHPRPPLGGDPRRPGVPPVPPPHRLPGLRAGDQLGDVAHRRRLRPAPARGRDPRRLDRLLPPLPAARHGGCRLHRAHLRRLPPGPAPGLGQGHRRRAARPAGRHPPVPRRRPPDRRRAWASSSASPSPSWCSGSSCRPRASRSPTAGGSRPTSTSAGARGEAILHALRDQLGLDAVAIKPFGLDGSAGSTPLRITLGDGAEALRQALRQEPPALGPLVQAVPHPGLRPARGRVDLLVRPPPGPVRGLPPAPHARRRHPHRPAVRLRRDHARAGVPARDRVLRRRHRDRRGRGRRRRHRWRRSPSSASCGTPAWPTATSSRPTSSSATARCCSSTWPSPRCGRRRGARPSTWPT